jgi:hypothetical protein
LITLNDLKWELRLEETDTTQDEDLSRVLARVESYIRTYCNNPDLIFEEHPGLDEVVLYLSTRAASPETRGRGGLASTSQGISLTFLNDLPADYKRILNRFRKIRFT